MGDSEQNDDWEARGINERRLGMLISDNRAGPELAAGVAHLQNAADAFEQAGRNDRRAECLLQLGRLQLRRGQYVEAAEAGIQAERLFANQHDDNQTCDARIEAAQALAAGERWAEAVGRSQAAVAIAEEINDHLRIAAAYKVHGRCCLGAGRLGEAITSLERSIGIFEQWRKRLEQAHCQELLGEALLAAGQVGDGDRQYETAVAALQELGRSHECTELYSRWADAHLRAERHVEALQVLGRAVQMHRAANHQRQLCEMLRLQGNCQLAIADLAAARESLIEAGELAQVVADAGLQARCDYSLGAALAKLDEPERATELLQASAAAAAELGDLRTRERCLATLARLRRQAGDNDGALELTRAWLALVQELGDSGEEIRALGSLASLSREAGILDESETHLRRLLALCEDGKHERERAFADRGLAALLIKRGEHTEALTHLDRAVAYYEPALRDPNASLERLQVLERVLSYRAGCHSRQGHAQQARDDLERCLQILEGPIPEAKRDRNHLAAVLGGLASASRLLDRPGDADDYLRRAQAVCEEQGTVRATRVLRQHTEHEAD